MPLARAPRTLWRYLTLDVLGILLIALLGLVGVIAFAAAMRPLAEGRLGPFEAARLITLLAVPMLQFAMPFAAGLAATLAYHRFASENEATASMAGGISHRAILAPALALGLVLSILLALLSHQVIPRFLRSAEKLLTRDVTRFIINPIERGETIQIGAWEIRADRVLNATAAREHNATPDNAAVEHLVLFGVLAHRVNQPEQFVEAHRVDLFLFDDDNAPDTDEPEGGTRAVLRFDRANAFVGDNRLEGRAVYTDALRIPSAFRDDPKFLDFNELRRVREHPEMLNRIEWRRRLVARHLAMHDMAQDVRAQIESTGKATLYRGGPAPAADSSGGVNTTPAPSTPATGADTITIHASALEPAEGSDAAWSLAPPRDEPAVRVEVALANGTRRLHTAQSARLRFREIGADQAALLTEDGTPAGVWLRLELEGVTTSDKTDRAAQVRSDAQQYASLTTAADHAGTRLAQSTAQIIADSKALTAPGTAPGTAPSTSPGPAPARDAFRRAASELNSKTEDLKREAVSKMHERAAFSASCLIMVLCGGVVALKLASALPLQVYLWSFLPALACVITISAGQGLAHKSGLPGLILLWTGVAALAAVTWAMYLSLRRH